MTAHVKILKHFFWLGLGLLLLSTLVGACANANALSALAQGSTATSDTSIQTIQQTQASTTDPFTSIRMLNRSNGWALTIHAILKTTDGGRHWRVLARFPSLAFAPGGDFLDSVHAWVAFRANSAPKGVYTILRTTDGGAYWQSTTIDDRALANEYPGIDRPHFVNDQLGWVNIGSLEGTFHSSMDIYQTTDGGQHWYKIGGTTLPGSGLPYGGNKTGLSFKDTRSGWVTAVIPANFSWLYRSTDGGRTWHNQPLPLPATLPASRVGEFITFPPAFFGNTGILPAQIYADQPYTVLYVSHNGGASWQPTSPARFGSYDAYALDSQHVWATDNNPNTIAHGVYATSDGGLHWRKLATIRQFVGALSFVDINNGWAIGQPGGQNAFLLRTSDGGRTWQQVAKGSLGQY